MSFFAIFLVVYSLAILVFLAILWKTINVGNIRISMIDNDEHYINYYHKLPSYEEMSKFKHFFKTTPKDWIKWIEENKK